MSTLFVRARVLGSAASLGAFSSAPLAADAAQPASSISAPHPIAAATLARSTITPATIKYSISPLPQPPIQYTKLSRPEALNEAGDIVGQAYTVARPGYIDCVAWNGTSYVDLAGPTSLDCYPSTGIGEANPKTGAFVSVGYTYVPTQQSNVPYYATISGATVDQVVYGINFNSWLNGVNAAGVAAGYTYYNPFNGFSSYYPAAYANGGPAMTLLQPQCTTSAVIRCMSNPYTVDGNFGKTRNINVTGLVLGLALNATYGQWIEATAGNPKATRQFSLPLDHGYSWHSVLGIDDAGDVVYSEYDPPSGKYYTYLYNPDKRSNRRLEIVPKSTCSQFLPIWVTGAGRVLGYTYGCTAAADYVYWTWDARNKTVSVNAGLPRTTFGSINAYMLTDKGQILIDITTSTGAYYWGTLNPAK